MGVCSELPGVVDHHVHLGLVDAGLLSGGPVCEVHDLGWDLDAVRAIAASAPTGVRVRYAGPFHTAVGGYPSGRAWAPAGAAVGLRDTHEGREAVARAAAGGAFAIKVALNADMPLLGDEPLAAVIDAARARGLPVIAHTEGPGQARRAIRAGVDVLAHTPWDERLEPELIDAAVSAGMRWISTLAIHDGPARATAIDNLARFRAAGGRVSYGTDMGNGDQPVGVNAAEIELLGEVGLAGEELLEAVCGELSSEPVLQSPHPRPRDSAELIVWLSDCRWIGAPEAPSAVIG
ncbi:hydrolase [Conexibacter sp. S30A1]|uniref:amidohydrolase family protein n=1 Tax=Conexibacter sp. S30A1 TaxID=2937800 RepID=UPI003530A78E